MRACFFIRYGIRLNVSHRLDVRERQEANGWGILQRVCMSFLKIRFKDRVVDPISREERGEKQMVYACDIFVCFDIRL